MFVVLKRGIPSKHVCARCGDRTLLKGYDEDHPDDIIYTCDTCFDNEQIIDPVGR